LIEFKRIFRSSVRVISGAIGNCFRDHAGQGRAPSPLGNLTGEMAAALTSASRALQPTARLTGVKFKILHEQGVWDQT
jgi:hypothetical protein